LNSFFPNLKDPSDWIDQELYNIIEKKTGHLPMLVLTHLDKASLKMQKYIQRASKLYADGQIFMISNYLTSRDKQKPETEAIVEDLLSCIVVKLEK